MWATNTCELYFANGIDFLLGQSMNAEDFEMVAPFIVEVSFAA